MTTLARLVLLLAAVSGAAAAERLPDGLEELLPGTTPWVVLGFVTDAEKNPGIEAAGQDLRKRMEALLQDKGARILPLAMAERLKWEQAWSFPFKARLGPEVNDLAKAEKANVLTGYFPAQDPGDITFLVHLNDTGRDLVFHGRDPRSAPQLEAAPPAHRRQEEKAEGERRVIRLPRHLEPSRERPMRTGSGARDDKGRAAAARLAGELRANPALLRFQEEHKGRSAEEITAAVRGCQEQAAATMLSSRAVEHLERAYVLSLLLPDSAGQQEELLREIAERRAFLSDRNRGSP